MGGSIHVRLWAGAIAICVASVGCTPPVDTGPDATSGTGAEATAVATVVHVVDGDTVRARTPGGDEERVRVIGIDTPEVGECGFDEATDAMSDLVLGQDVVLTPGARDERDRYDRLLAYLDVDGTDAGLRLIEQGLAVARYDSRDGHGRHTREDRYVAADARTSAVCD